MNHLIHLVRTIPLVLTLITVIGYGSSYAQGDGPNPSNPLAAVTNTDLRVQYFDRG